MNRVMFFSIALNILLVFYVVWLKMSHDLSIRTSADYMTEIGYQIGYQVGKNGKYPKYDECGPTRIDLIKESEKNYILRVPTRDNYCVVIDKVKNPEMCYSSVYSIDSMDEVK